MQSPGRGYGVRELAADLRDFRDRQERRYGNEDQQRQQGRGNPAACRELRTERGDGECAQARCELQLLALAREIV